MVFLKKIILYNLLYFGSKTSFFLGRFDWVEEEEKYIVATLNTKGSLCLYQFQVSNTLQEQTERSYASIQTPKQEIGSKDPESLLLRLSAAQQSSENTVFCYEVSKTEITRLLAAKVSGSEVTEILFARSSKNEIVLLVNTNKGPLILVIKFTLDSAHVSKWFSPFSGFEFSENQELFESVKFRDMFCLRDWVILLRSDFCIGNKKKKLTFCSLQSTHKNK